MPIHNEIEFENDICSHLEAQGWQVSLNDTGYDRERALFPEDVFAWIKETQPKAWQKFADHHGANAEDEFLKRLAKVLDEEGTLGVLRNGFKAVGAGGAEFRMVQFRPAHGLNPDIEERYRANRLRVVRQVHYSTKNQNSIDLVLFLNGLPVATIEVKTQFTQSIEDAKAQYRNDRDPKNEPLLTFKRGALVHFALSTEEIAMTTRLAGTKTYFLPFNKGNQRRAGNPPNPNGYDTHYLWDEILVPEMWLRIVGSFIQLERKREKQPDGKFITKETLIFPRYHQLSAVNELVAAARREGTGHKYLLQHSAGSGKSNTIAWCAHQFATLHNEKDEKVFDTVIVITDRTVLDDQLQETIKQFHGAGDKVVGIDRRGGSKSKMLAKALKDGALIVVVTLQTFPYILSEMREEGGLKDKRFAIIIDEAHSSQSGKAAHRTRQVLGSGEDEDDAEEKTVEDMLIEEAETRKLPSNASFFAFTATPKTKTLELFGTTRGKFDKEGKPLPEPFHLYTMRQAIDEGFILDVLKDFLPYRVAYRLSHGGKDWDEQTVEKSEGMKQLNRWVRLHPHNIAQKVEIIVEHFRQNVAHLLGGKAKAMVVTNSRAEAVRYKLAMDQYIKQHKYAMATIVAFSGDVNDKDIGPDKFNEGNMNDLKGQDIREAFATDEYQVLIVANKFQTGFDQPLLCAMYVDKRLDGITAVQTLSRLNRTYPGKEKVFVLDFVNKAEDIRKAFEPYYEETELLASTDPNLIYDTLTKLKAEGLFTEAEVENVAKAYLEYGHAKGKLAQEKLIAALTPCIDRFRGRWKDAEDSKDEEELKRLVIFHKRVGGFGRLYDFISQIGDYQDPELEAHYIFCRHLEPFIRPERIRQPIDLTELKLTHHKIKEGPNQDIKLGSADEDEKKLRPITQVGAEPRDPEKVKLTELVEKLNDLFDDGSLTDADMVGMFEHVAAKMMENEALVQQATANTRDQFKQSPTLQKIGEDAAIEAMDNYEKMGQKLFSDKAKLSIFLGMLADHVFDKVNSRDQAQP
jgi:type I restriction enzyme R subunit